MKTPKVQTRASLLLVVVGAVLVCFAQSRDVVRQGDEPIAGLIGIMGLFAIFAGIAGWWNCPSNVITQPRRLWLFLTFENLVLFATLTAWRIISSRNDFFSSSPSGANLLPTLVCLVILFAFVLSLALIIRLELRTPASMRSGSFLAHSFWKITAASLAIAPISVALCFLQTHSEIEVGNGVRVIIGSRGFPRAAIRSIRADRPSVNQAPETETSFEPRKLSDGTLIKREGNKSTVVLPGGTIIEVDLKECKAAFAGGVDRVKYLPALWLDGIVAILIAIHVAVCFARVLQAYSFSPERETICGTKTLA